MADDIYIVVEDASEDVFIVVEEINDDVYIQIVEVGEKGDAGATGQAGNIAEVTVSENILAFDPINSDGTKANSAIVGKRGQLIGLALANINNGLSGNAVLFGEITNPAWSFVAGNIVYLNGTTVSTTPPSTGFIQKIGTMKSSTTLEINIGTVILI
jgi:hypothetical protein